MKKTSIGIGLIGLYTSLLHATTTLTVYPGSQTYIRENYAISNTGPRTGIIPALPSGITPLEIRAKDLISACFFPETQKDFFLKSQIGNTVKQNGDPTTYLFKGIQDNNYVLQRQNDILIIPVSETSLTFEKAAFTSQSSMILNFANTPPQTVSVGYFSPELHSEMRYRLDYTKTSKATLTADLWIHNNTNHTFPNSKLIVKVGSLPQQRKSGGSMRLYAAAESLDNSRSSEDGEIVYDIAAPIGLLAGTQTILYILPPTSVSVSTLYRMESGGPQEQFMPLRRILRFRNTTGKALAAGSLTWIADDVLQKITDIPTTLSDQFAEIDGGTAYALLGKKVIAPIETKASAAAEKTETATVTLKNDGTQIHEVEVRDYISERSSILHSSHPFTRISPQQILFKLSIEPQKELEIRYTYKRQDR